MLRDDEQTLVVARYIINNPVRARLVVRAEDYEFSRSDKYTIREIVEAVQLIAG